MADAARKPRVAVLPAHGEPGEITDACDLLRLVFPFTHDRVQRRFDVEIITRASPLAGFDVLVVQRHLRPELSPPAATELIFNARKSGIRVVYDLDDNLLDRHPNATVELSLDVHRPKVRMLCRQADLVVVSTHALKARVANMSPNVFVAKNALPEAWIAAAGGARQSENLSIGYFGTLTHLRDFMEIAGPLKAALTRLKRLSPRVVLCGISTDPRFADIFRQVARVDVLPVDANYATFFSSLRLQEPWSIGLAPLRAGAFENCKSDIKHIEYAALGIPAIHSDVPAYEAIENGRGGLKCDNEPEQWLDAIMRLAESPEQRRALREAANADLMENRRMDSAADRRIEILESVLSARRN
jgi:glycosyltransferase involved in cell wall biosynthesis